MTIHKIQIDQLKSLKKNDLIKAKNIYPIIIEEASERLVKINIDDIHIDDNFTNEFRSTINSINLLLRNDKDVNNLVVKIIQHTKYIKKMINHFISKLLKYKNKRNYNV